MRTTTICLALAVALAACNRPSEERALAEDEVGHAAAHGATIDVADGLAAIRTLEPGRIGLWASAPVFEFTIDLDAPGTWEITIENVVADSALVQDQTVFSPDERPRPTVMVHRRLLDAGRTHFTIWIEDGEPGSFRFAAMADIQTALSSVHEVFAEIATTSPRFVVCMGDLTDRSMIEEYDLLERQLHTLPVPFYTTLGNHELWEDPGRYFRRYGRASFQFVFKGVAFTFVDSGDAGLDPIVEGRLDGWLAAARDRVHVFLTHFPPIDPIGTRYGSFRSRRDAHRLLSKLADANVDLTLYGHVHSYLSFDNAGIPAFISGGGGAMPERWDGIGRHFLVIDITPTGSKPTVGLHRVD